MEQDRGFGSGFGGFGGGFGGKGSGPREGAGDGGGFGRGSKLFDDLAGVAGGAFSALTGIRNEAEAAFRAQAEAVMGRLDLVRREDLDAAMELARRAREEAEGLTARVAILEKLVATMAVPGTGPGVTAAAAPDNAPTGGNKAPGASVADPDTLKVNGGSGTGPARPEQGGSGGASETDAKPNAGY